MGLDKCFSSFLIQVPMLAEENDGLKVQSLGVPKTILTPDTNFRFCKLQTTLRFDNLLEGLTELTASHYTHGYSLLQQKNMAGEGGNQTAKGRGI